jgi:hypothetical protein
MATTTATSLPIATPPTSLTHRHEGVAAVRGEWTKFRTLRSTWLTSVLCIVASVALAALASASDANEWPDMDAAERAAYDATSTTLVGVLFGALVLGALGVRSTAGEYGTGMIRTTAAAVPRRPAIVTAKVSVTALAALLVALVANVAGFAVGAQVLRTASIDVALDRAAGVAIVAGAVAVTSFAVMGVALGAIVRRAAVANIVLALVVIGGQLVGSALPSSSRRFLPSSALQATVTVERTGELLTPLAAVVALAVTATGMVGVAVVLVRRRDV